MSGFDRSKAPERNIPSGPRGAEALTARDSSEFLWTAGEGLETKRPVHLPFSAPEVGRPACRAAGEGAAPRAVA